MQKLVVFALICLVIALIYNYSGAIAIVRTPDGGRIIGSVSDNTPSGRQVYQFHNIPYALPPTGDRRFRYSDLVGANEGYNGILDARYNIPISCSQPEYTGIKTVNEDCLVLTVITPDLAPETPLPVVFWIHGGGLVFGANHLPGYTFTGNESDVLDAVVVNINYRLGYLGFLQLKELWERENSFGNYGIQDQTTALKWVQKNIRAFGGNPDSVTIIGESAGGTSVLALLSSPLANNLFQRAISLSPGPEMRYSHIEGGNIQRKGLKAIEKAGCENSNIQSDVLKCMRNASAQHLGRYVNLAGHGYFEFPMKFGRYNECIFMIFTDPITIPLPPKQLKNAKHTPNKKIKIMLSNTKYEDTLLRIFGNLPPVSSFLDLHDTLRVYLKNLNFTNAKIDLFLKDMDDVYKDVKDPQYLYELLTSDIRSTCPINDLALEMGKSKNHDVYRMLISTSMASPPYYEAAHAWDTEAIFGFIPKKATFGYIPGTRDFNLRDNLRQFIKKFIRDEENMEAFPESSLIFGNEEPMMELVSTIPRDAACALLRKYGLDIYGAQN